jgi:hypothetical protein
VVRGKSIEVFEIGNIEKLVAEALKRKARGNNGLGCRNDSSTA